MTDVTAVGSPDRAERAILGGMSAGRFLVNSGCICGGQETTDVTAVRSPDSAEHTIFGVIVAPLTERNVLFWG